MFSDKIKYFFTKKNVKKSLSNVKHIESNNYIVKVGVVFDESYFHEKEAMIKELISYGIKPQNIKILAFRDKIKKNETFNYPIFSHKNLTWSTGFDSNEVNSFIQSDFDLLINYYDTEKAALLLLTHLSKASFKVGFGSIDKRLNHFMIKTNAENYKVFVDELFKYLKILNKI